MSTYQHLPGIITYAQDYTTEFDFTVSDGVGPRTETITLALSDFYAWGAVGAAAASTMAKGVADAITAAFSTGSPNVTVTAAYSSSNAYYHPVILWEATVNDASYTTAVFEQTGDSLGEIGIRASTVTNQYSPIASVTIGSNRVHSFVSNGFPLGLWAPGMPCRWIDAKRQIVRKTRSPYSPGTSTTVRLGTSTNYDVEYDFVNAAALSDAQRTIYALVTRAGYDLSLKYDEANGTLDALVEAIAQGKGCRLYTSESSYFTVDMDADALDTAALFQPTSAGGALGSVTLPLIKVA